MLEIVRLFILITVSKVIIIIIYILKIIMKFSVNSKHLFDAVNAIVTVVAKKTNRPILSNTLFKIQKNKLEIMATDLDISAKAVLDVQSENDIKFCLNTKNIHDILRELPEDVLELTLDDSKNIIQLKCKNVEYSLLIASSEDFPETSFNHNDTQKIEVESELLKEIISKTSYAMSNDETRMFLNGIYLQELDKKVRAVAIDGHRLALIDKNISEFNSNSSLEKGIIIPRKGVTELKKICESGKSQKITISFNDSFLIASNSEGTWLSIRLIAREYPKYETVIPSKTNFSANFNREDLYDAIKRIKILSNENTKGVRFSFKNDKIELRANNEAYGEAYETINASYKGEEIEMSLNAGYVLDTLTAIGSNDISFELNNSLSPLVIKSQSTPDFLGIIMPLRI